MKWQALTCNEDVAGSTPVTGSIRAGQPACCLAGNRTITAGGANNEAAVTLRTPAEQSEPLTGMSALAAAGCVFVLVSGLCGRLD